MVTDNDRAYTIREIRKDEVELLKDFLYEAIFIPEGVTPPPRSILDQPELRVYIDDFGSRKGDHCLVADCNGKVVGAVWTRIMDDYGHVDDDTPSFAISLLCFFLLSAFSHFTKFLCMYIPRRSRRYLSRQL